LRLAVSSSICTNVSCSSAAIDIFDVNATSLIASIDLTNLSTGPAGQLTNFCEIEWAPDDSLIAFVADCDASLIGNPKEAYVANPVTGGVNQITTLTPSGVNPLDSMYNARIDLQWNDDSSLLIGIKTDEGLISPPTTGPLTAITLSYDALSGSTQQIALQQFTNWATGASPIIGYLSYTYPANPTAGDRPIDASVEVSTLENGVLRNMASGPSGCRLSWNKDGSVLAYLGKGINAISNCLPTAAIMYFMDAASGNLSSHIPSVNTAISVGWLDISDGPPSTTCDPSLTIADGDTAALISAIITAMERGSKAQTFAISSPLSEPGRGCSGDGVKNANCLPVYQS
jgi:hypothetical protein